MVDAAVVVPLLPLGVEVSAGPPCYHVNDSAIWLISEVFLLWGMGDVLMLLVPNVDGGSGRQMLELALKRKEANKGE
jgi:hypothetical protein